MFMLNLYIKYVIYIFNQIKIKIYMQITKILQDKFLSFEKYFNVLHLHFFSNCIVFDKSTLLFLWWIETCFKKKWETPSKSENKYVNWMHSQYFLRILFFYYAVFVRLCTILIDGKKINNSKNNWMQNKFEWKVGRDVQNSLFPWKSSNFSGEKVNNKNPYFLQNELITEPLKSIIYICNREVIIFE